MTNNLTALKRQLEILSMFYPKTQVYECTLLDLAEKYKVAEVTINRDLKDLRSMGIPINSIYGKGIGISGKVNPNIISELLVKYIAIFHSDIIIDGSLYEMLKDNDISKVQSLSKVTSAIENKEIVKIKYKTDIYNNTYLTVLPCVIIHRKEELLLVGIQNQVAVSFKLINILSVDVTGEYDPTNYKDLISEYLDKNLSTSAKIKVKLKIETDYDINDYRIFNFTSSILDKDIVEAEINHSSIEKLAFWVIKQYGKVKVIEPQLIKDNIANIARFTLNLYEGKQSSSIVKDTHGKAPIRIDKNEPIAEEESQVNMISDKLPDETNLNGFVTECDLFNLDNLEITDSTDLIKKKPNKPDVPMWLKKEFDPDNKKITKNYKTPLNKRIPTFDSIEVDLQTKDINDYNETKTSIFKRLFNWIKV